MQWNVVSTSGPESTLISLLHSRSLPLKLSGQPVSLLPRSPLTHKCPPCQPRPQQKLPVADGGGLPQLCPALHYQRVPAGKTPVQQLNKRGDQNTMVNYKRESVNYERGSVYSVNYERGSVYYSILQDDVCDSCYNGQADLESVLCLSRLRLLQLPDELCPRLPPPCISPLLPHHLTGTLQHCLILSHTQGG